MNAIVKKMGITSAMVLVTGALVALSVLTVGLISYSVVYSDAKQNAVGEQDASMRIAATVFSDTLEGVEVSWGGNDSVERIEAEALPEFTSNDMIDKVGRMSGQTVTVFVWDPDTRDFWRKTTNIIKPDGKRAVGTSLGQNGAVYPVVTRGQTFRGEAVILGKPYFTRYQPIFSKRGEVIGILYTGVEKAIVSEAVASVVSRIGLAIIPVLAVALLASWFLVRGMLRPITDLAATTEAIAEDRLDVEIPHRDRSDQVAVLAKAVETLKAKAVERQSLAAAQSESEEESRQRQLRLENLIDGFRSAITEILASLSANSTSVEETAQALSEIAGRAESQAEGASNATEQATNNVQTVASAADELSTSISEISRQVSQSNEVVAKASAGTLESKEKITGLASAVQKIGEVVNLIQDIAEQTNLLALNATIEAARAGEMGKGFAVVAAEVKELATQTSRATEEIGSQIGAIQASTDDSVRSIQDIANIMEEVSRYTTAIASSVEQQGAATAEISRNVNEASEGTKSASDCMAGVTGAATETRESASKVLSVASEVADSTDRLRAQINDFLKGVAA